MSLVLCIHGIVLSIMIGLLFWGLSRGFELVDEGLALTASQFPADTLYHSSMGYFLSLCPDVLGDQVRSLRFFHVLSRLVGSFALPIGIFAWMGCFCKSFQITSQDKLLLVLFSSIGSLLPFAILQQTLSYNGIVLMFLLIATSLLFAAFTRSAESKMFSANIVLAGMFIALSFPVKFTASLALLLMSTLIAFSFPSHRKRYTLNIACGIALGFGLYFSAIENAQHWYQVFSSQIAIDLSSSHGPSHLLANTGPSLQKHALELGLVLISVFLIPFLRRRSKRLFADTRSELNMIAIGTFVALCASLSYGFHQAGYLHTSLIYVSLVPVLFFCGLQLIHLSKNKSLPSYDTLRFSQCVGFLLLLPFAISFGTDTPLLWNVLCNFTSLYLGIGLLYAYMAARYKCRGIVTYGLPAVAMTTLAVFVQGYVFYPHNTTPLLEQTEKTTLSPTIAGLMLDHKTAAYLIDTSQILKKNGFEPGDPVLTLFDAPGLAYALQARIPGGPWYRDSQAEINEALYRISTIIPPGKNRFFVVVTNEQNSAYPTPRLMLALKNRGIDLKSYRLIGVTYHPFLYWGDGRNSYIYANQ